MNTEPGTSLARTLRCPKCRQQFETMRRFRLACTECGHEWEEESVLSTGDKLSALRTDVAEYLFIGFGWAILIGLGLGVLALFIALAVAVTGTAGLAAGLVVAAFAFGVVLLLAIVLRPSMEASARLQWWVPTWKGPGKHK